MNYVLALPLFVRIVLVIATGACAGGLAGWAADLLRSAPDSCSSAGARARRTWRHWLPIVGWWRRSAAVLRPLAWQVGVGLAAGGLYWWEVVARGAISGLVEPSWAAPSPSLAAALHWQFLAHALLAWFLLVASAIDLAELTIPDGITIPGTIVGLLLAAVWPASFPPHRIEAQVVLEPIVATGWEYSFYPLHPAAPREFPAALGPAPRMESLAIGLGCYLAWIAAVLLPPWRPRRGIGLALRLQCARAWRAARSDRVYQAVIGLGCLGGGGIAWAWSHGGPGWGGLISALVGLAVGGGIIWAVRVIGSWALGKEAMGFGDVTLMAMIGAFVGWQGTLFVFFLAPMAGLVVGGVWLVARGQGHIPFGPFLCLAAVTTIAAWGAIWRRAEPYFALGWLIPQVLVVGLVLLGVLLAALRGVKALRAR